LRVVFIPLFLICNYQPLGVERVLPVYIKNDYLYWIIAIAMSYSSGYLSSLAMMYAPRAQTSTLHQIKAGMMAAAMLISGIFAGIMFSFMAPIFVKLQIPF
jgi:equilibrative nucleoside transporter 1/2/3